MMLMLVVYLINFDACKLQSNSHSPGAGGAEVRVELWPYNDEYEDFGDDVEDDVRDDDDKLDDEEDK